MEKYCEQLVEYMVRYVDTMFSWVLEGEQPLKHKGPGHGLHESAVICSTFGWMKEASVTMGYGKNYEGYWTGELFVKQVKIFIF